MQNERVLKSIYGSRLYGLNTPTSDEDFYEIYKADLRDIVLKKDKECSTKNENNTQLKEYRKFISDAMSGQTYALELLFAPDSMYLETSDTWKFTKQNRNKLLSKNLRPFVAYAEGQAKKYSYKNKQLKLLLSFMDEIKTLKETTRLKDVMDKFTYNESIRVEHFGNQTLLCVVSKKFDWNVKVKDVMPALNRLLDIYGLRSFNNVEREYDPKAYSHALRLSYILDELMTTGNISYPVINRDYLMQVKLGNVPFEQVTKELARVLDKIDNNINVLPEKPDVQFWEDYIYKLYTTKQTTKLQENE